MNQKNGELKARLTSAVGVILGVLGFAFLAGSGLAYLQRVVTQIIPLAVTGVICLVGGIVMLIVGRHVSKRAK